MTIPRQQQLLSWPLALLVVCVAGCAGPVEPGPQPSAVSPASGPDDATTRLTITGGNLRPRVQTDFDRRGDSRLETAFQVRLGRTHLRDVVLTDAGQLEATVPAGLAPGRYTLTVVDPAGREGSLPEAFEIFTPVELSGRVAGFRFEPIGGQRADEPFPVTVVAVDGAGERVAGYNGTVRLSDGTGEAVPRELGPFRDGAWSGAIEVRRALATNALTVTDAEGRTGRSEAFRVAPRPVVALRFSDPERTLTAGDCSRPFALERVNDLGQPTGADTALEFALEQEVPGLLGLYADAGCTVPMERLAFPPGVGSLTLHVRSERAARGALTVRADGPRPGTLALTVVPGAPARLAFLTPAPVLNAGMCAEPAVLEVQDTYGNASPVTGALTLSVGASPASGFGFHTDAACAAATSELTLAAGEARVGVRYRATAAGAVTVEASAPGLASATQPVTVRPEGAPTQLVFTTGAQRVVAGGCSGAVRVRTQDSLGNASANPGGLSMALSTTPPGTLFADAACTQPVTQLALTDGATEGTFFFKGTLAGALTLTVSASGLLSASQQETIDPGPPARIDVDTAPQDAVAGACSQPVGLRLRDAEGNTAPAPAALSLALAASPSQDVRLFSDAACSRAVATVDLASGQSVGGFYFQSPHAGPLTLTASAPGLRPASQVERILPAAPQRLAFTSAAQQTAAGACSQPVVLEARDAFGNTAPVAASTALTLTATPGGTLKLFSDATCATPLTSPAIAAGSGAVTFSFQETAAGTVRLDASATGLTGDSQTETVVPAPAQRLAFVTPPRTVAAGSCSAALTVETRDAYANPSAVSAPVTLALSSTGAAVELFSDAGCATRASGLPLAPGDSRATFYVRGTTAGQATLTVSSTGLASTSQDARLQPAPADRLAFATPPRTVVAGACSAELAVEPRDAYGNVAPLAADALVALQSNPSAGLPFYTDAACTKSVTSVLLASGASRLSLYVRGTSARDYALAASTSGLSSASQVATVTPAPVANLAFTSSSQTLTAGTCTAGFTVQSQDAYGNPSPLATDTLVTLTAVPASGFAFHADTACATSALTSLTLPAGSTQAGLAFRGTRAGPVNVTAAASGLASAQQTESITAGPVAGFAWDAIASPQVVGFPFAVTVRAKDAYGNAVTTFTGTAALGMSPAGTVSCAASCTNASTTATFTSGVWTGRVTPGLPAGTGRQLTATSGSFTGTSNSFDVLTESRDPAPLASFTYGPAALVVGQSVSFDASGSTDNTTPASALEVSWDFTGTASGPPPWTDFTATKTASFTYTTPGTYTVRLAVRDGNGGVGYAAHQVVVLSTAADLCVVNTSSTADDGASSCAGPFGTDGKLSLVEAVRLSNKTAGKQTLTFSGPMTIPTLPLLTLSDSVDVVAPSGVTLSDANFSVSAGTALLAGLVVRGSTDLVTVSSSGAVSLVDMDLAGGRTLLKGTGTLLRVRMNNCGNECLRLDASNAQATVRFLEVRGGNSKKGIFLNTCTKSGYALELQSSVLTGLPLALDVSCGTVSVLNNTFHANTQGVKFAGNGGHVLRNNLFTQHTDFAVDCGTATFSARDRHLLFGNLSDGCVGGDADTLAADPRYVDAASLDVRLQYASPARDSALDVGLDLNDAAPGNFLGAAPDRGGRESF